MSARFEGRVIIVGAGLAGALAACALGDMGLEVEVYERRPDPRAKGFVGGRSINLALSCRGITALKRVGLADRVLSTVIPMRGRMMHSTSGELTFQAYSADPTDAINSVSRAELNLILIEAADRHDHVSLRFDARCAGVDLAGARAEFEDERTGASFAAGGDLVLGADGAFSAVRDALRVSDRFDYSQEYLEQGYKELTIPPAAECGVDPAAHDGFAMEPNALHIWPRRQAMMIALPNQDRSFTCTCFWPFEGERSFAEVESSGDVRGFFQTHYPDAMALMPTLTADFERNPTSSLVTIRCSPWEREGRVLLIGDAAHAIVPFFGQGANAAFEDVRLLCERIEAEGDLARVVVAFSRDRKEDVDAIADMALDNFIEMRDRVADPAFLFRKRVDQALYRIDPARFSPRYNLVSFSNIPYTRARDEGGRVVAYAEHVAARLRDDGAEALSDDALTMCVRTILEAEAGKDVQIGEEAAP
jgi:kynurenine 3-monooxygenase